jgi:hypothetical protein
MALQTTSPEEAEVAEAMLARLDARHRAGESQRVIGRERIMHAPDRDSPVKTVRWRTAGGTWINADLDDFELDEAGHLRYGGIY